ncbi:pirin family protein [Haliea sp.]
MNAHTAITSSQSGTVSPITGPIAGRTLEIGSGFQAQSFKYADFGGAMDPLIMVDHFTMSESTFGPHGHAGISAVSVLFEDSVGAFNNRDSLDHDIDLMPGDLYWLKAGKGGMHDEKPRPGSRAHGLQMFVNLPAEQKYDDPIALHVKAGDMPIIEGSGYRVRVVLGESNGVQGARSPALPMTILDMQLSAAGRFSHSLLAQQAAWLHAVDGSATILIDGREYPLPAGRALALRGDATWGELTISSRDGAQVALVQGQPLHEKFVQRGPFAMATEEEVTAVAAACERGEFGTIQ